MAPLLPKRACAGVLVALVLTVASGCGDDANFLSGGENNRLNEELPASSGEMRAELARLAATLEVADWRPGQPRTDAHAVACARLFDVADLLRYRGARFDLDDAAYERVARANRACDERPREAGALVKQAVGR